MRLKHIDNYYYNYNYKYSSTSFTTVATPTITKHTLLCSTRKPHGMSRVSDVFLWRSIYICSGRGCGALFSPGSFSIYFRRRRAYIWLEQNGCLPPGSTFANPGIHDADSPLAMTSDVQVGISSLCDLDSCHLSVSVISREESRCQWGRSMIQLELELEPKIAACVAGLRLGRAPAVFVRVSRKV